MPLLSLLPLLLLLPLPSPPLLCTWEGLG